MSGRESYYTYRLEQDAGIAPATVGTLRRGVVFEHQTPTCRRCGERPADGSGIMCTQCWIETGEPVTEGEAHDGLS